MSFYLESRQISCHKVTLAGLLRPKMVVGGYVQQKNVMGTTFSWASWTRKARRGRKPYRETENRKAKLVGLNYGGRNCDGVGIVTVMGDDGLYYIVVSSEDLLY